MRIIQIYNDMQSILMHVIITYFQICMHMERFFEEKGSVLIIDAKMVEAHISYNTPDNLEERFTHWHMMQY